MVPRLVGSDVRRASENEPLKKYIKKLTLVQSSGNATNILLESLGVTPYQN